MKMNNYIKSSLQMMGLYPVEYDWQKYVIACLLSLLVFLPFFVTHLTCCLIVYLTYDKNNSIIYAVAEHYITKCLYGGIGVAIVPPVTVLLVVFARRFIPWFVNRYACSSIVQPVKNEASNAQPNKNDCGCLLAGEITESNNSIDQN